MSPMARILLLFPSRCLDFQMKLNVAAHCLVGSEDSGDSTEFYLSMNCLSSKATLIFMILLFHDYFYSGCLFMWSFTLMVACEFPILFCSWHLAVPACLLERGRGNH